MDEKHRPRSTIAAEDEIFFSWICFPDKASLPNHLTTATCERASLLETCDEFGRAIRGLEEECRLQLVTYVQE